MSEALWTPDALADAIGGRPVGPEPRPITGISIDSAGLLPGDAYFAIGQEGHSRVGAALAKGASLAVVAQERLAALGRVTGALIVVDDVAEALGRLAVAARARYRGKVVALIGNSGDTRFTAEMLRRALARSGAVHGDREAVADQWRLITTLARLPEYAPFAVFEVSSAPSDDVAALSSIIRPNVAVVAATDEEASIAGETALTAMFGGIAPGGTAILNRDGSGFEALFRVAMEASVQRIISFGRHQDADARVDEVADDPPETSVRADIGGRAMSYFLEAGDKLVMSSLAMLAAVQSVAGDLDAAGASLSSFTANGDVGEDESGARDAQGH